MRAIFRFFSFLAALSISAAYAEDKPLVVTSVRPLSLMAADLAGDWLEIRQLLKDNQEPHHAALSISQRKLLLSADLILWVGPELESFLARTVSRDDSPPQLNMAESAGHLALGRGQSGDPHLWMNPAIARRFYQDLAVRLKHLFPEKTGVIDLRLKQLLETLDRSLEKQQKRLSPYTARAVIADHQAYGHFTSYMGIRLAGFLVDETGVAGGAKNLARLMSQTKVACVVVEQLPATSRARRLATALDVKLVAIDPLGYSVPLNAGYPGLLETMTAGFVSCLES